jgi:hypothetical protein
MTTTIIRIDNGAAIGTIRDDYAIIGSSKPRLTGEPPQLWYTADKIVPDLSDTDCYGEPCEEGAGYRLESGWVDPCWSRNTVYDSAEHVAPDVYELHDGPLIEWLTDQIINRLGWVDLDSGCGTTLLAAEFDVVDQYSGVQIRMAVHMENVPDAIVRAVLLAIKYRQGCTQRGVPCNY